MPSTDAITLLRMARQTVVDGGDTDPCEIGQYCLRCCVSIAKSDFDDVHESGAPLGVVLLDVVQNTFTPHDSDRILLEAIALVRKRDSGITHTKESALALLDEIIDNA